MTSIDRELADRISKGYSYNRQEQSLDYDLYVINPNNKDTTPEQLRDCIYDALQILNERTQ